MTHAPSNAAPDKKPAMRKQPDAPPGIEVDNHGNPIPVADRTADDKAAATRTTPDTDR